MTLGFVIVKEVKFVEIGEWLRTVFYWPLQLTCVAFYAVLLSVPVNQFGFIKRFLVGLGIGICHLLVIGLILRKEGKDFINLILKKNN